MGHIFSHAKSIIVFGNDDKKSMIRRLDDFLKIVCKVCKDKNLKYICEDETRKNTYIILIRKNYNFPGRLDEINQEIKKFLQNLKTQMNLDSFVKNNQ